MGAAGRRYRDLEYPAAQLMTILKTIPGPSTRAETDARLIGELTARLRDGALYSVVVLHREAAALVSASEAGAAFDVTRLAKLAQLAQSALARFQAFTAELDQLIGELVTRPHEPR